MAIKRNSAGFISNYGGTGKFHDFEGKQLKVRTLLKYMYDGDTPTICMGKDFNGEPDYDSMNGELDLGTLGMWHNVAVYYKNVQVGTKLSDWKIVSPYVLMFHAPGDKNTILFSYLKVRDTESGKEGWVDSRAVDPI